MQLCSVRMIVGCWWRRGRGAQGKLRIGTFSHEEVKRPGYLWCSSGYCNVRLGQRRHGGSSPHESRGFRANSETNQPTLRFARFQEQTLIQHQRLAGGCDKHRGYRKAIATKGGRRASFTLTLTSPWTQTYLPHLDVERSSASCRSSCNAYAWHWLEGSRIAADK